MQDIDCLLNVLITTITLESDDGMTSQPERIAALEQDKKWHWIALVAVATLLMGWCGWLSVTLFGMKGDIQAIKQKIADGGNGAIVTALHNPSSLQQLAANLGMVSSQVRVARVEERPPNLERLSKLSGAVKDAAVAYPDIPEVWQAEAELISYRSQSISGLRSVLPDCLDRTEDRFSSAIVTFSENSKWLLDVQLRNCTLLLDDNEEFHDSTVIQMYKSESRKRSVPGGLMLELFGVKVVYSGGVLLPVDQIGFRNCAFELRPPNKVPPSRGRLLSNQLLTADLRTVNIQFPIGM